MFSFRKPSSDRLAQLLEQHAAQPYSYSAIGATASSPPAGFIVDRTGICLGRGPEIFHRGIAALRTWQQFRLGWVDPWPGDTPLQPGQLVAIQGRVWGLWSLNLCRIVYLIEESGPPARFGFAYGTLPAHVECGEEQFLLEHDPVQDEVRYQILAFSRPQHPLARLAYPLVRRLQKRFGLESARAMFRTVRGTDIPIPVIEQRTE